MHKIWAILLLFSFIFGDAIHVNVLHVPNLAAHFRQHRKEKKDLGFLEFLRLHYIDNHGASDCDTAHSTLPFKAGNTGKSMVLLCYEVPDILVRFTVTVIQFSCFENTGYATVLHSGFRASFFHPPSC